MFDLWTDEFFVSVIERKIKHEISMKFLVTQNRQPTKEEYESTFHDFVGKLKCNVTDYDLCIYND
jgi:hypothetical protein